MSFSSYSINRRSRQRLHQATAWLSLALWLFLLLAEVWTPLHAWIHGGSIPENDHCAIVAVHDGKIEVAPTLVQLPTPVVWGEILPPVEISFVCPIVNFLPSGRAPPVLSSVS